MAIRYSKELVSGLRSLFQPFSNLNDGLEKLHKKRNQINSHGEVDRGPYFIEFIKSGQVFEEPSAPKPLPLAPFIYEPNSNSEIAVWLGFRARLDMSDSEKTSLLTSLSISFIRGTQSQYCLFRAEWEPRSIHNADHAQPHWHAISGNRRADDPVESRWGSIQSAVHLAMCARWRQRSDECGSTHAFDFAHQEDVFSWVRNVLNYAKTQLGDGVKNYPSTMGCGINTLSTF